MKTHTRLTYTRNTEFNEIPGHSFLRWLNSKMPFLRIAAVLTESLLQHCHVWWDSISYGLQLHLGPPKLERAMWAVCGWRKVVAVHCLDEFVVQFPLKIMSMQTVCYLVNWFNAKWYYLVVIFFLCLFLEEVLYFVRKLF